MNAGAMFACVVAVGVCTYTVDYINHKRQKADGVVSIFPAIRNALLAALIGTVLAYTMRPGAPGSTGVQLSNSDNFSQLANVVTPVVRLDRVPRLPAAVSF
jgi:glycerol uptake facilitator-like aquaporin